MRLLLTAMFATVAMAFPLLCLSAQNASAAIASDPVTDKLHPAALDTFQLPSHGALLNAFVYIAAGAGPHPTVILLHGFPGNERNLDVAQSIRRAGYNVLYFDYRGAWGSPGDFSFTHCIEDTQAAIAYLRDPANSTRLRGDPSRIVLIGHSMGGFMARYVGAHDPAIKAVGLISAADMGVDTIERIRPENRALAVDRLASRLAEEGLAPLAGCTPKGLAEEIIANTDKWNTANLAPSLSSRPLLVITSDDGLAASNDAFVAAMPRTATGHVTTLHLATDHSYSDQRIALQTSILNWLAGLSFRA
jgi:pimeloyl-ACP methyl ester carboxylesterase